MSQDHIKSVSYSEIMKSVVVTFNGGSVWSYHALGKDVFDSIISSENIATAVHEAIRAGEVVGIRIH